MLKSKLLISLLIIGVLQFGISTSFANVKTSTNQTINNKTTFRLIGTVNASNGSFSCGSPAKNRFLLEPNESCNIDFTMKNSVASGVILLIYRDIGAVCNILYSNKGSNNTLSYKFGGCASFLKPLITLDNGSQGGITINMDGKSLK